MATFKKILKISLCCVLCLIFVIVCYLGYMLISYTRIDDNLVLAVNDNPNGQTVKTDTKYTILTQNIGFGAYTPDFTFFMDGGESSIAESWESVINCTYNATKTLKSCNPDFLLIQEVDTDSDRSHHVNQRNRIVDEFVEFDSVFAINYHSPYIMWPLTQPIGTSNSGIMTLSKYQINSAKRRSLPVSRGISKFLDLDRCYSVCKILCENGKSLVIYNIHASAYGGSAEVRTAQLSMLFLDMKTEYENGNYVVCGGDFNHDFTGTSAKNLNKPHLYASYDWAQPFPDVLIPDGFTKCTNYQNGERATCRNCDLPYGENCFTIIVDGFIVSDNVLVNAVDNIQTDFSYSDHSPVILEFELVS